MRKRKKSKRLLFQNIITIIIILLALRYTTIYDDIKRFEQTCKKIESELTYIIARWQNVPDWAIEFYRLFKGDFG